MDLLKRKLDEARANVNFNLFVVQKYNAVRWK